MCFYHTIDLFFLKGSHWNVENLLKWLWRRKKYLNLQFYLIFFSILLTKPVGFHSFCHKSFFRIIVKEGPFCVADFIMGIRFQLIIKILWAKNVHSVRGKICSKKSCYSPGVHIKGPSISIKMLLLQNQSKYLGNWIRKNPLNKNFVAHRLHGPKFSLYSYWIC